MLERVALGCTAHRKLEHVFARAHGVEVEVVTDLVERLEVRQPAVALSGKPSVQREARRFRLEPDLVDRLGDVAQRLVEHTNLRNLRSVEVDELRRSIEPQFNAV